MPFPRRSEGRQAAGRGAIEKGVHPKEFLKGMVKRDDPEEHGYKKRVMRYSSTYRHTGVIGH